MFTNPAVWDIYVFVFETNTEMVQVGLGKDRIVRISCPKATCDIQGILQPMTDTIFISLSAKHNIIVSTN